MGTKDALRKVYHSHLPTSKPSGKNSKLQKHPQPDHRTALPQLVAHSITLFHLHSSPSATSSFVLTSAYAKAKELKKEIQRHSSHTFDKHLTTLKPSSSASTPPRLRLPSIRNSFPDASENSTGDGNGAAASTQSTNTPFILSSQQT